MQQLGRKLFIVVVLGLLAGLIYVTLFSQGLGKAPEITVKTNQNSTLALHAPKKPVLVNFWATTCPGCIAEMPHLAEIKREFGDQFELVAISMDYDPKAQVQKFIENNPYPFSYVMDTEGKLAQAFGDIQLTPTSFLIAPNGNIVYQKIGEVDFDLVRTKIQQMTPDL